VLLIATRAGAADPHAPLRLVKTIPLVDVEGRIDHLAVDLEHRRLFVAALGNGTLEAVDLGSGQRVGRIEGLDEPQGVLYLPESDTVVVSSGGGTLDALDATSWQRRARLTSLTDADNVRRDPKASRLYLGYGNALAAIEIPTLHRVGDIPLGAHPESFQLEATGERIFVNVASLGQIVVIDRGPDRVVARWSLEPYAANFPMALDEAHHRLLVGTRKPPRLLVLDTGSGEETAALECVADADDVFLDGARDRVYVIGGAGFVDVFERGDAGRYERTGRIPTSAGARTGTWVPEWSQLLVAAPARAGHSAEIQIYEAPSGRGAGFLHTSRR
jgi:hypothetical protein